MAIENKIEFYKKNIYNQLNETVIEFSLLERGACNNIYLFKTITGKLYCLKEERFDKLDGEVNDILTEANLIEFLYNKSVIYTPKISFVLKKHKTYCYEYIKGETLDTKWDQITKEERMLIMKDIGKYHAELYNKIPAKETLLIGVKNDRDDFNTHISNTLNKLNKINKNSKLYTNTLKMQESYKKTKFDDSIKCFLHGDLHKGNILINKNKLVGVVDFGKSTVGDVHKDFSHHMRHYPEYIDIVIKSYETETGTKLSKNKIIIYAFLKDMEKLIYHVDKYETHKNKMEKKFDLYNNLLSN